MKNILITGASGLVGSNLIKKLSEEGEYNLIGLYKEHPINFRFSTNINFDITNKRKISNLEKFHPEIIIHCAALANISFCELNEKLAYNLNVGGTQNIAELARKCNSYLIYISTDAVFRGDKGNYNEKDTPLPSTVYGKTKLEGEQICLETSGKTNIIRTNLFGKNILSNKRLSFIENILDNLKKEKTYSAFVDVKKNPLYVTNFSDMMVKLIKEELNGIFHIGGKDPISNYDFAVLTAKVFGYNPNLIKKTSVKVISKKIKNYPKDITMNNKKILKLLNYEMPSLESMLRNFKKKDELKD